MKLSGSKTNKTKLILLNYKYKSLTYTAWRSGKHVKLYRAKQSLALECHTIQLPQFRDCMTYSAFVCRNINVWNRLPAHVVNSDSVAVFKHRLVCVNLVKLSCFFVTVRAGTAYRKIWRLVTLFARIMRFTVQKFQLFWVIFCIVIFFIELWHILILWSAKMPNGGMPVFTLIATGWRYRKIFFYKKTL